jgi:hypothetical protein
VAGDDWSVAAAVSSRTNGVAAATAAAATESSKGDGRSVRASHMAVVTAVAARGFQVSTAARWRVAEIKGS